MNEVRSRLTGLQHHSGITSLIRRRGPILDVDEQGLVICNAYLFKMGYLRSLVIRGEDVVATLETSPWSQNYEYS